MGYGARSLVNDEGSLCMADRSSMVRVWRQCLIVVILILPLKWWYGGGSPKVRIGNEVDGHHGLRSTTIRNIKAHGRIMRVSPLNSMSSLLKVI